MREAGSTPLRLSFPVRAFLAGCVISLAAAAALQVWIRVATVRQLDEQVRNLEAKLSARVGAYLALLRGVASAYSTQSWLEREHFRRYFRQLEVGQNYPGVQGVGISVRVSPAQLPELVNRLRREIAPDFHLWPAGPRSEYHSIIYLDPENARNRAALGYDMHTDPVRSLAMDRARDTGQPAVSGSVTLVQEIDVRKQPGFLIYVPFYSGGAKADTEAERRARLAGYAYAAFRAGDFIDVLLEPSALPDVRLSLYDGTVVSPVTLIFGEEPSSASQVITRTRTIRVADRPWTVVCTAHPQSPISPYAVGLFGLLLSTGAAVLFRGVERARRRAEASEAETRDREGRLAVLVDAIPALVSYLDRQGVYRLCNHRYAEWFGSEPASLVGRSVADVVGPEVFATIEPQMRRALGGETVTFEQWYRLSPLGARFLATSFVPHRDEVGEIRGLYALTSDLTAHKRSEEAAQFVADCGKLLSASMDFESNTRGVVRLAVPRVADVAVLFRVEGGQLRAAAVAHADEAIDRRLRQFLDAVRLSLAAPHNIAVAARTGAVVVSESIDAAELQRVVTDDAQRQVVTALQLRSALHVPVTVRGNIWAVFSFGTSTLSGRHFTDEHRHLAEEISTRVRLAVENALLYREAQQEIEERSRAERVARTAEERFRLLVDGVRDYAIIALDPEGRIESWNNGAERNLGYAEPEATALAASALYTPEDQRTGFPQQVLARARDSGAASEERWFVRKDGSQFWASSHTVVLRDEDEIRGFAWILRDLTDRKRNEEELERRVQARTAELNEAVHELEAFSYSVSHDLRAPLRTIRGFTELTLEEGSERLTDEHKGYLERVRRAAVRLERLIGDLLAYTRVSKTKVELRPVDLHALVSDIQREHPEFQLPLAEVQIEGQLQPVIGNEAYLTQCITNLLGNAVKFVAPGVTPAVRIWSESRGDLIRLCVQDNGIGIATDRLAKAFEMFERLHTGGAYEGTGVGLAIVRRAVQRMKGSVGVVSAEGKGSTFWLELPAA